MSSDERSSLLGRREPSTRPHRQPLLSRLSTTSVSKIHIPKAHSSKTIVILLSVIVFVASCSNGFTAIPLTALVEEITCRRYYDTHSSLDQTPIEARCRISAIQSRMAYTFAAMEVSDSIVAILAAFPWGVAADKLGRKPVVAASLAGISLSIVWRMVVLSFPNFFAPDALIFGCLFQVLGGTPVLLGIILSMLTDVVPEAERATAFTRIHVASIAASLISPALASSLMTIVGPWPLPWIAVGFLVLAAVIFAFIPESLRDHHQEQQASRRQRRASFRTQFKALGVSLRTSLSILKSRNLVLLLLTCFLTYPMVSSTSQFLVQFVAERYTVSFESTGFMQAGNGIVQATVALFALPFLSHYMLRDTAVWFLRREDEQTRDLSLARWSFILLAISFVAMGLARVLPLFIVAFIVLGLGSAGTSLLRSIMSLYVDPEHTSRLYSLVGMVEVLGNTYGSPMLAWLFSKGMDLGEPWVGMPYLSVAILMSLVLVILLMVRVPTQIKRDQVADVS